MAAVEEATRAAVKANAREKANVKVDANADAYAGGALVDAKLRRCPTTFTGSRSSFFP